MSSKELACTKNLDYLSNYNIRGIIGKGTFSVVKLGENKATKEKVAIKILQKNKILSKEDLVRIEREIHILRRLNHPNVIKIHHIFEDQKNFYIIMEFCENGELFNRIVEKKFLTEEEASIFYYQLINGLEYIHKNNIVHRDLKPENLLLSKNDLLKIIDFGLSNYTGYNILLGTPCGSPCYASPEMVSGKRYDGYMIDVWSTGIILFAMVCGYLPFEDNDNEILFGKILKCKIHYPKSMGKLTLDLMKKIITPDPKKRITLEQIKQHPFYLKGKALFKLKFPELINEIEKNENNNPNLNGVINENNNPGIKEIIIKNVTPIVKTKIKNNIKDNIKENKDKNDKNNKIKYYSLKINDMNDINNIKQSYLTEINQKLPINFTNKLNIKNNEQNFEQINIAKPQLNPKEKEINNKNVKKSKENIITKDYRIESPSSLKSDEIPQDSVPVELTENKIDKINNIQVKLDLNKNLNEEMKIINITEEKNIKNINPKKIYKLNPKIQKEREKILINQTRTIEKDRKKIINNVNYITTATSEINERIIDDLYQKEKLNSTLENNTTLATKMDYYNMKDIPTNKYSRIKHKIDKNYLNNKSNQISDNKNNNNIYIKEIKNNYFTNNNQNPNYTKLIKITNSFSKKIQRKPIYNINNLNERNIKNNIENNMNLTNVSTNFDKNSSKLNTNSFDKNKDILYDNNKNKNVHNIFNQFQIIQNNTKTISTNTNRSNVINNYNNKTKIIERNIEKPLIIGKTITQTQRNDINNKKDFRLNNYVNPRETINLNSDRNYHNVVRNKNMSMSHNNKNKKIIMNDPTTNNSNIYINNKSTNFKGVNPMNDKYFDTITINNNNSINLHEPKLYIYVQNNNTNNNLTDYQRLKTESNTNKTKMIFKLDNKKNNIVKNVNKINSVEYNKNIPTKRLNTNLIEKRTLDNDIDIKRRSKITPIKNNQIFNNNNDIKKNEKFIITKKIYNSIEVNKKMNNFKTNDIVFNNSKKNKDNNIKYISSKNNNNFYYNNNSLNKNNINNNLMIQSSNLSKSIDNINSINTPNYIYQNMHNIIKTDGNMDVWSYDDERLLTTTNNNNVYGDNYIKKEPRNIIIEDINYANNNMYFDNMNYKTKLQKYQMKNYLINNKENTNKNLKFNLQNINDNNTFDSFNNYCGINSLTSNVMRTPESKQNYKNIINYKQYVKHY